MEIRAQLMMETWQLPKRDLLTNILGWFLDNRMCKIYMCVSIFNLKDVRLSVRIFFLT